MKFKKGDIVVCIDNTDHEYIMVNEKYITLGYDNCYIGDLKIKYDKMCVCLPESMFISLLEYRKNKMEKIKNEIQKRRHSSLYK